MSNGPVGATTALRDFASSASRVDGARDGPAVVALSAKPQSSNRVRRELAVRVRRMDDESRRDWMAALERTLKSLGRLHEELTDTGDE